MKRPKRNGYMIIFALVTLSLFSAAIVILSRSSNDLLFDSNRAYLEACTRNLSASGLAWVRENRNRPEHSRRGGQIDLPVGPLGVPDGHLRVTRPPSAEKPATVQIDTRCRQRRMTINRSSVYVLPVLR